MATSIPTEVAVAVKERLGTIYDELLVAMLDLGTPPLFLFSDDRHRLVTVRAQAISRLEEWPAAEHLFGLLPQVMQLNDQAASLLEAATWADYFELPESTFLIPNRSARVFTAVPDLLDRVDDDGLLVLTDLDARPHGLFISEVSLHYHQLLRRGFGSNVNYDLVGTILGIADQQDVDARIAIDERRLRFRSEHEEIEERDYWYGPPLGDRMIDDPYLVGETIHGDRDGGQSIFNPYIATSFRWTVDDHLKTIEIEELVPVDENESGLVLARYLHAIRDVSQHRFIHCDGAVKAYSREGYPRVAEQFANRGKGLHYRKVFRMDGDIQTDHWSQVAALWFRGNQLVPEYLGGRLSED
jgi:hypothetical protein